MPRINLGLFTITIGSSLFSDRAATDNLLSCVEDPSCTAAQVQALIESNADVNAQDRFGYSVLMNAIFHVGDKLDIIQALIRAGADVNYVEPNGDSVLFFAAKDASPEVVKALVDAGANVNAYSRGEQMAVITQAYYARKPQTMGILIDAGAKIDFNFILRDSHGVYRGGISFLEKAVNSGDPEIILALLRKRHPPSSLEAALVAALKKYNESSTEGYFTIATILLSEGARLPPEAYPDYLVAAVCAGRQDRVSAFIREIKRFNIISSNYTAALDKALVKAAELGSMEIVELLLAAGADVNAQVACYTPICKAAEAGHAEIAKLLLENGAYIRSSEYPLYQNPISLAVAHPEIVRIFIDPEWRPRFFQAQWDPAGRWYLTVVMQEACRQGQFASIVALCTAGALLRKDVLKDWIDSQIPPDANPAMNPEAKKAATQQKLKKINDICRDMSNAVCENALFRRGPALHGYHNNLKTQLSAIFRGHSMFRSCAGLLKDKVPTDNLDSPSTPAVFPST